MKWTPYIALTLLTFGLPLVGFSKHPKESPPPEAPPFDADLFRKDAQVFSAHLEFLYWTVEEGGLDYALKMDQPAWGPSNSYAMGNFQTAGYGFDPGMRLSLSFFRAPKNWEVKWSYTRLTNRGSDRAKAPTEAGQYLTGTWPQIFPTASNPLTRATSSLHFNYNVADMLISRVFYPNPHLRLYFTGGPATAWMKQDWYIHYNDAFSNVTRLHNTWTFAGGGLKTGTVIDWFWTGHMYITAKGIIGILMGSYHNHAKQTTTYQPTPSDNPNIPIRDAKLENIRASYVAQAMLGPSWQKNYDNMRLEVFAGYELTIYTDLQEIYHSTAGAPSATKETWTNTSNLALHGVTVRFTGDF